MNLGIRPRILQTIQSLRQKLQPLEAMQLRPVAHRPGDMPLSHRPQSLLVNLQILRQQQLLHMGNLRQWILGKFHGVRQQQLRT